MDNSISTLQEPTTGAEIIRAAELIQLGSVSRDFFCRTFFPKTARQKLPPFHHAIWDLLESSARLVNIQAYRGSGKTTTCRLYTAKRIAYGFARTILYVGKSEGHATRSVRWLRRQIEAGGLFAKVFQLSPGMKWQDHECEIKHGLQGYTCTILALGVTGSTRGINIDDYRPDLIVLDDIMGDEDSLVPTKEQLMKIEQNVYGSLRQSLAPKIDSPDAKLVSLATPQAREDYSMKALEDKEWVSLVVGCWTPDSEGAMIDQQYSNWEERNPTIDLRKEKKAYIARNQLSLWMREKECKITSPETSAFIPSWLRRYDIAPAGLAVFGGIDPVPPPSQKQIDQGLRDKDYECLMTVGVKGNNWYVLDYSMRRGHEPNWTVSEFFRQSLQHRPRRWIIETVAYQQTLMWILKQAMNHQKRWYVIEEFKDQRKKHDLIVDALSGIASNGHLYIRSEHAELIQQFSDYPSVSHDDVLNTLAIILTAVQGKVVDLDAEEYDEVFGDEPKAIDYRGSQLAP